MIRRCSKQERLIVLEYFEERFGIKKETFKGFSFYAGKEGRVFLGPKSVPRKPRPISSGMLIARLKKTVKPATNFIQLFGKLAKKNFVNLLKDEAVAYMRGEYTKVTNTKATVGYVIVSYGKTPLGCGLLRGNEIKNMLPKAKRLCVEFL